MAPEIALTYRYLRTQQESLEPQLSNEASRFAAENGYFPTYSQLCQMALSLNH